MILTSISKVSISLSSMFVQEEVKPNQISDSGRQNVHHFYTRKILNIEN